MAEVEIYKRLWGKPVEYQLARHAEVQAGLDRLAQRLAVVAQSDLDNPMRHPYSEGHSYIIMGSGRVDRQVILVDPEAPHFAAWAIEQGTERSRAANILQFAKGVVAPNG